MAMSANSVAILKYLQENDADVTAKDVAGALGLDPRSVNGTFTALTNKKLGFREEAEVELPDGTHAKVKFLRLTDAGKTYDPATEVAE